MMKFLILLVALWIGLLALLVSMKESNAATIKGNPENCFFLANLSQSLAQNRDMGMPLSEAKPMLEGKIKEAMGLEGSLVQDADDATIILLTLDRIYGEWKDVRPVEIGVNTLMACMSAGAVHQRYRKQRLT